MSINGRFQLLRRLCPGDRSHNWQQDLDRARIPSSCQHLLDHPNTRQWLSGESSSRLLWLHGPSASGKTFFCSRLVDHIRTMSETTNVAVAFFCFQKKHRQYNIADFGHALTSVLRQLVSQLPSTSGVLRQLETMSDTPYPGDDHYAQIIHNVASEMGRVFIVFDGANNVTALALKDLMDTLNPSGPLAAVRVLFASRNATPQDFATSNQGLEITSRAQDLDLHEYIIETIQDVSGKDLSSFDHSKLVKDLVRTFDGVFFPIPTYPVEMPLPVFLASLGQLITICGSASISNKIDAFCRETMSQIQASRPADMVLCVLYHVIKASEAGYNFTVPMAVEALSAWQIHHHDRRAVEASEVMTCCNGLIFCGEGDLSMHIQSPLFSDYLKREVFGTDYNKRSNSAKLRYLSSEAFANGASPTSAALKKRLHDNRYLWYAARMLSVGLAAGIPDTFVQDFLYFSSQHGSIESYLQAAEAWPYESEISYDEYEQDEQRWRCFTPGYSPLHLAAHLVAPDYLIDALVVRGDSLEARDSDGRTALHLAAEIEEDNSTIRALVGAGSNVSAKDKEGQTPLVIAVIYASPSSVKLLLDNGADLAELDEDVLEECGQENPKVATHLRELGLDVPFDNENDTYG